MRNARVRFRKLAVVVGALSLSLSGAVIWAVRNESPGPSPSIGITGWYSLREERGPNGELTAVRLVGGTLDGRLTIDYRRAFDPPPDQSDSVDLDPFVSGNERGDVLLGVFDGQSSELWRASLTSGVVEAVPIPALLVHHAIPSSDGSTIYFVRLDEGTRSNAGIWSFNPSYGLRRLVGPPASTRPRGISERLLLTPDHRRVVARFCIGRCSARVIDLPSGRVTDLGLIPAGDLVGTTESSLIVGTWCQGPCGWSSVDLSNGRVSEIGREVHIAVLAQAGIPPTLVYDDAVPEVDGEYGVSATSISGGPARRLFRSETRAVSLVPQSDHQAIILPAGFVALSPDGQLWPSRGATSPAAHPLMVNAISGAVLPLSLATPPPKS